MSRGPARLIVDIKGNFASDACGSTTINAPGQERVKGNELGGGLRRPFARKAGIDLNHDEECKGVGGLSGM
jgi:hypothetical protein